MDTLQDLKSRRDEFIGNPGTDPDYDSIVDEIGAGDNETEQQIHARWFDHVIDRFSDLSSEGSMKVHRMISIEDVSSFISTCSDKPLGSSWSWDQEAASCEYHPEANYENEIMLIAEAPVTSICWQDCMVQHFGHPHEREIVIEGPVCDLRIILEGKEVARIQAANA